MSIALAAIVHPSRLLRALLFAYGAACALAALALLAQAGRFHAAPLLALVCGGAALLAWQGALARPIARQIDISGLGEIRVSVQQSLDTAAPPPPLRQLLPGSTLWPGMLMLLLHAPGAGTLVLSILPDSVAAGQFRKLVVALRVIAGRDNKFSENNKIL